MERFKDRRPSVGESKKRPVARLVATGLIIFAGAFGAEAATGGAVSKALGNAARGVAGALVDLDNRDYNATSAGIPAQKLGEAMRERDQADQAREQQAAKDKAESEALRQALNPRPKQFP